MRFNFLEKLVIKSNRAKTPTVLQMEAVECGAASLAIVLSYYGKFVPLEVLRVECGVSRDGSKASNLLKVARNYGLVAQGKRLSLDELVADKLLKPFIVFWNFNHFLVVEGFDDEGVYLNDPASGPRKVSLKEFDTAYTGICLAFEVGPEFKKGGEQKGLFDFLLPRIKKAKFAFGFIVLASFALVIPGLVIPVFTQVFVDNILIGHMDGWVKPLLVGMAITAFLRTVLTWLQQTQLLKLEMQLALASSGTFFWHVLRLPVDFFNQRYVGDISQRVSSNDDVAKILAGDLATNFVSVFTLVFFVVVMLQYDVLLTFVGVMGAVANFILLKRVSRVRKDGNTKVLQDRSKLMATTIGGIQTIETIKATGGEQDFFVRWSGYKAKVNNVEQDLHFYGQLLSALPALLNALVTVAILALGGNKVISGGLTIGMLVAFQSLMTSFYDPFLKLLGLATKLQEAEGSVKRLEDVLNYPVEANFDQSLDSEIAIANTFSMGLELKEVTFGYSKLEPPLIENFSMKLLPGKRVALVGGSGSGKSTIAKLVMGINKPWSGEILIGGSQRDKLPSVLLNAILSSVDQEIYLFEGRVKENISLWDSKLSEEDIVQAAKDACIHEIITARDGGYEAVVSERGANFSGGQGQRLEIARALATNPCILVMDEATAALDPVVEKEIDSNVRRRGCACLIVAHRLSTIRDCDEIIVMDKGKIVERGTHDLLINHGGVYAGLVSSIA